MPARYEKYFLETPEGRVVHPRIRALCHFGHINLLNHSRTAIVGRVDAIFCRNVLIYFDSQSRRRVIDTFYQRLAQGGYLLLGHSESLLNASTAFELVHLSTDLVYRRPVRSSLRPPAGKEGTR
jgi:chemotaxis protein methyltransferase CheR